MDENHILPELGRASVFIKNRAEVNKIIRNMVDAGMSRLQVVADFDWTLTRFIGTDGLVCDSTHRAIERSPVLPEKFRQESMALKEHYYQIEVDPNMSIAEKTPFMVEWWQKAHEILVECHIKKESVVEMVQQSHLVFRDGCDWLFSELHSHSVPLLIFSAGVGDIIEEAICQRSHRYDNMRIVSNFMLFDDKDVLIGFQGELLHVFNKNEHSIHKSNYFEKLYDRDNVLLLGDSLGDVHISEGAASCTNLLKIGFLNDKIEERRIEYMDSFDIVVANDPTMDIPNAILRLVLANNKTTTT